MSYLSNLKIKKLDDSIARDMANFYLYIDPWVYHCREYINNLVFKGNIEIQWGKTFTAKKDSLFTQTELVDILTKALDWKKLYGMCPYKVVDDEKGKKKVFIPQFGSGSFYQVYNPHTLQPVVFYIISSHKYGPISEYMSTERFLEVVRQIGLPVYTWPGMQPNFHMNDYSSEIAKIYREYLIKQSYLKDTIDASYNSTHPTLFTQSRLEHKNIEELTTTELYSEARAGFNLPGPTENKMYQRNQFRTKQTKNFSSDIRKLEFSGDERKMLMDEAKHLDVERPRKFWEENVYSLPINETIAQAPVPKAIVDIEKINESYRNNVCTIMGLTKTLVEGQFRRETTSSNELIKHNLRILIDKHRKDAEIFLQDVYNTMYGLQDKTMILEMIMEWKNQSQRSEVLGLSLPSGMGMGATQNSGSDAKQKQLGIAMLQQMLNRNDMINLIFEEQPLLETENPKDVEFLLQNDYVTFEEAVDLQRKIIGLPPLTPAEVKKLSAQRQEKIDFERKARMMKGKQQQSPFESKKKKKDKDNDKDKNKVKEKDEKEKEREKENGKAQIKKAKVEKEGKREKEKEKEKE